MSDLTIHPIPAGELERLRPLWESLRRLYLDLTVAGVPIREADASWARRRATYAQMVDGPDGFALGCERDGELIGYAVAHVVPVSPVFGWSERAGELETLAVAEHARGAGAGALLLAAVRGELAARGVDEVVVHVLAANRRALDFYRREGFAAYQVMLSDAMPSPFAAGEGAP